MIKSMQEIHEDVYHLLMSYHKTDKENFFFAFRKINRYKKLDKGYWFLGNDKYLAVSFWTGTDFISRTPRIFFRIKIDGSTSIEFRNKDVASHNDYFPPQLINDLGAKGSLNGYRKKFNEKNYLTSLKSFLANEKKIIDKYIREHSDLMLGAIEWANPLDFINPQEFNHQLKNILNYREKVVQHLNKIPDNKFLRSIDIQNFGPIKRISIEKLSPENNWIFLTGENGSGKTSVLKAIAVAICQNIDRGDIIANEKDYGKFKISLDFFDGEFKPKKHIVNNELNDIKNKNLLLNGFASYGPFRLLTEGTMDIALLEKSSKIHEKLTYGLFHPISVLKDLTNEYALNEKPKYYELTKDSLIGNLEYILPNIATIKEDKDGKLLFYGYEEGAGVDKIGTPFENLPSGTRNYAALILDLLIRLQHQQPGISDISNYKGLVLIDEIDIHLHPKLQIELVKQLSATFPDVQFIVSTHSPIPLLGAPKNSVVCVVKRNKQQGTFIERVDDKMILEDMLPNSILSSPIFGFKDLFPISHDGNKKIRTENTFEEIKKNDELKSFVKSIALKLKNSK